MNNNHMNNSNAASNANSQQWMMGTDHRPEYNSYMLSRPPGSVLPIPPHQQQQQQQQQPPAPRQRQSSFKQDEQGSTSSVEYETPSSQKSSKSNRSVIPSKRAAQNRAAQKAFRQRREQYIKDLEIKAKEMDEWQAEMEKLRKENKQLRDRVIVLENQVNVLTGGDPSEMPELDKQPVNMIKRAPERSMSLPITKNSDNIETIPKRSSLHESRLRQEVEQIPAQEHEQTKEGESFVPVPLRAPNQASFDTSPPYLNEETKRRKIEEQVIGQAPTIQQQQQPFHKVNIIQQQQQQQMQYPFWDGNGNMPEMAPNPQQPPMNEFELDFDFDPFFEDEFGPTLANNNDFLPNANSNQVLDDLFAMLQTRQRPQIPLIPSDDTATPVTDTMSRIG